MAMMSDVQNIAWNPWISASEGGTTFNIAFSKSHRQITRDSASLSRRARERFLSAPVGERFTF
jgi:hypothetical protein